MNQIMMIIIMEKSGNMKVYVLTKRSMECDYDGYEWLEHIGVFDSLDKAKSFQNEIIKDLEEATTYKDDPPHRTSHYANEDIGVAVHIETNILEMEVE